MQKPPSNERTLASLSRRAGTSIIMQNALEELLQLDKEKTLLSSVSALISWDQVTYMPSGGIGARAEQSALLSTLEHERATTPRVAELLHILGVSEETPRGNDTFPQEIQQWLRRKHRSWQKAVSVPPSFVKEFAQQRTIAHSAWEEARKKQSFALFAPHLKTLIELSKNYAMCIGYENSPYDALLDDYEPGCTTAILTPLFSSLRASLGRLHKTLSEKHSENVSHLTVSVEQQKAFNSVLARALGIDGQNSRLDESIHPFCSSIGWEDVRITTRYIEKKPLESISAVLHETGHALYELGIAPLYRDTICATGASFGIHESQSRFLENIIGKSKAFWEYWHPVLCSHWPSFGEESLEAFMKRLLSVKKTAVRLDADEVGYNLHIILRFEIEKIMFEEDCRVADIPSIWNEKSKDILGILPKNDVEGVLQDVHWAHASFGYFPSYTLGNIYAAQLEKEMSHDLRGYEEELKRGEITSIMKWLSKRVHIHGAAVFPQDIFPDVDTHALVSYLEQRYAL